MIERDPEQVRRVQVHSHARHHAHKYRHPLRKARLFALRDGLFETIRKARSKLVERRVEAAQHVLLCAWDEEGARRVAVTRDLGGRPRFHAELVFAAVDGLALDAVRLSDEAAVLLEAYLPVPECPLAGRVAAAVRAVNPGLRELHDGRDTGTADVAVARPSVSPSTPTAAVRGWPERGRGKAGQVFLLGYGGYVREQVLPAFNGGGATVAGAVDHKAELLRGDHSGGFPLYRDLAELLPAIAAASEPLVIVATYHSDHARSTLAVLDANPDARVFVEKPVSVTVAQAEALAERRAAGAWIDVGFNRRYAAMTGGLRAAASRLRGPLVFSALVKELRIPPSHWYHWPNQGTRVTGNLCHWIDLAHHLIGGECVGVRALAGETGQTETVSAILEFVDGSVATLVATDAGDDLGGVTEYLELRGGETTVIVDDYRRLIRLEEGRRRVRRARREKGHRRMYQDLRRHWLDGAPPAYPAEDILAVARTTAEVVRALGPPAAVTTPGNPRAASSTATAPAPSGDSAPAPRL
jgi:predicted dehydrogenase